MFGAIPCFFFFNDTATTEIYTLSLHDALPIWMGMFWRFGSLELSRPVAATPWLNDAWIRPSDRKSTRLNSSHSQISYAVFCLKKKKTLHLNDCYCTDQVTCFSEHAASTAQCPH